MVQRIGIDFGTTNSLISVVTREGRIKSFTDTDRPHPSVVRYESDQIICGRKARDKLEKLGVGVLGNTVRGPKKLLGLDHVNVDGRVMSPTEVVTHYVRFLLDDAHTEDTEGIADLTRAVVTIPVAMDGRGRQALRESLLAAGVYVDSFVHEPLAALYGYLKDMDNPANTLRHYEGRMILVFDWGGGTLDLTLCKAMNGTLYQVLSRGNNKVGGDYIDDVILGYVEQLHADRFGWNADNKLLPNPGMRAKLLTQCERAKIVLSTRDKTNIFLPDYYQGQGDESEIDCWLTREELDKVCSRLVNQGIGEIERLLSAEHADVDQQTISLCLATGGMINMPMIKRQLTEIFGVASLHLSEKGDRIISEGAAWVAHDNLEIALAKPFELVEARNSLLTIIPEGTRLPSRGNSITSKQSMYCSDPRDGKAIFTFKRPQMVGKSGAADPRTTYGSLVVEVNPDFPPLGERIELQVTIDENLIVHVQVVADDKKISCSTEYYDLEFALIAKRSEGDLHLQTKRQKLSVDMKSGKQLFVRSNVTMDSDGWAMVPGELLKTYNDQYVFLRQQLTRLQVEEYVRYQPCSICGAAWSSSCCGVVANTGTKYETRTRVYSG